LGTFGVFAGEALLALVLPDEVQDNPAQKANAILMASAPLLLHACKKVSELLGNGLVVTQDGFKIDAQEVKGLLTDAIGTRSHRGLHPGGKVDMYTLQKLLTHKSPVMTQRYAHLRCEALRNASEPAGTLVDEAVNSKGQGSSDAAK
jgi:hypothetical protein